jgi:hypothetical protein
MPPTSESNVRPVGNVHACNHRDHPSDQLPDVAIMTDNNAALVLAKDTRSLSLQYPAIARPAAICRA